MSELLLDKEIYPIGMIEKAIHAYEALSEIKYKNSEKYHILEFAKCRYDENLTMKEYENYVLDLLVSKEGK